MHYTLCALKAELSGFIEITGECAVTRVEGAHHARLDYGEPVEEGGRDEGLHHDDQDLGARHLLLGQPASPAGHSLAALLPPYQGTEDVEDPVKKKTFNEDQTVQYSTVQYSTAARDETNQPL